MTVPGAATLAALALMQAPGGADLLPKPPTPGQFEAFGFAGIIFGSFFFLICAGSYGFWRYLMKRDEQWTAIQNNRDATLKESLSVLGSSHERAVERVASAVEKAGDASAAVNRETAQAMRDLQKEVQSSHRVFSEDTVAAIMRRALRDVKSDG